MKESKYEQITKHINQENSMIGFQKFVYNAIENKSQLFDMIKNCRLDEAKCRFNVWRMCLKIIDIDCQFDKKVQALQEKRKQYENKRQTAFSIVPIKKESTTVKNPLIKNPLMGAVSKNQKVQANEDEFLKDEIRKDVERTYQDMIFFQNEKIIKLLSSILFVWCKGNPQISYKQGMNEILASIVFIYFQQTAFFSKKPEHYNHVSEQIKTAFYTFNDANYAQADIYMVFDKIMTLQKEMYKTQDSEKKGHVINPSSKNNSPILQRIIDIQDHKLKFMDLELFRLIKMQDIKTKSFLLRWIRCMHTREFGLTESFNIWDSIFLDYYQSPTCVTKGIFQFIDAMCLAMFIYLRSIALSKETANEIMQTYQKYPVIKKGIYLQQLISLAWSICETLRNPEKVSTGTVDTDNKAKKLHFLQKGGKLNQVKTKEQPKNQQITRNSQQRNNQFSPERRQQSSSPRKVQQVKVQSNIQPQIKSTNTKQITLTYQQWQEMESLLKKSLQKNTDIESKSIGKKALKILQNKIRQLQQSKELIKHKDPLF